MHLAGIIPVAGLVTDHETTYPEVLTPLCAGYTAIQRAVQECAMAGCQTIWIVANNDLAPIVRKHVGEWVYDPVYYARNFNKFYSEQRKEIPIYYVPIHPRHRGRIDCYGWSVLYGAHSAWDTARRISKWIKPDKFYAAFPMSVYDVEQLREHRRLIAHPKDNFFLCHGGLDITDDIPIAFTFTGEDFKRCRTNLKKKTTKEYLPPLPGQQYPSQKLPLKERWSARHFRLGEVFSELETSTANHINIDWYYDISTWEQYTKFISQKEIKKPYKALTEARFHVKIPYVDEVQD